MLIKTSATSNEQESTTRNTLALPRTSATGPQKDVPVAISAMLFQRAIEYHEKDVIIAKDVGDRAGEGRAYCNLGNAYHSLGDFQRAIEYHEKHLNISKDVVNGYKNLGDFQRVIEYHEKDLSIAKDVGNRDGEAGAYCNLGNAYHSIGDFQQVIECHEKDLSIAKDVGNGAGEGGAYCNLGNAYHSIGDFQRAIEYHEKHLSITKDVVNRAGEGRAYGNLGNAYQFLGDFQRAIEYHEKHLSIAKDVGDRAGEGRAYGNLGNAYYSLGDFQRAIEYHEKDLSIAKDVGDWSGEGRAYYNLGISHLNLDPLKEVLAHFRFSVETHNTIRASLISKDVWKISFRTIWKNAYTYLWQVLIMLQKTDEALDAAEQGRAQALQDALEIKYGFPSFPHRCNKPEEEVTNISRKTSTLIAFLAIQNETINLRVLGKERNAVFRQAKLTMENVHEDSFAALLEASLKKIDAGVDVRCENRSLDKVSDNPAPKTRGDDRILEPSRRKTDWLQPLYDVVIGPIEDLLNCDELIVVPDGALSLAPWAALSESLRIRTVPSLAILKLITASSADHHTKDGVLLVGDPSLEKVTNKRGKPIHKQLNYAKKEVEMIGGILNGQPLTGEAATKQEVLKRIESVALVHIAAHGRKETGEIALAPNPGWQSKKPTPMEEDYILKMSDIQATELRARLVVLSCCHSGKGEVNSEGVVGMARAFLFAGARSVLVSLWAIDDEATMEFMKSFYQHLRAGESASHALQKAMKCLRESENFSAPKYWAPFGLIGDDFTIQFDANH